LNALGKGYFILESWVMNSGASHHMTPSMDSFPSLCSTSTSSIEVGDSSHIFVKGKGDILVSSGHILDVLVVLDLSSNLLSVYQICNIGYGRTILFTPNDFEIRILCILSTLHSELG